MRKLINFLSVLMVVMASANYASAATLEEDFTFSYTTDGTFTLSNLLYAPTSSPTSSVLGASLFPYTTATGGSLGPGTGKLSEVISVDSNSVYVSNYSITNFTGNSSSFSVTVSPVPLPASFPLFAMALVSLSLLGYCQTRRVKAQVIAPIDTVCMH